MHYFYQNASRIRRELTANFHRLNVLLIHIEEKSLPPVARKVAMATMSEAKIQINFGMENFALVNYMSDWFGGCCSPDLLIIFCNFVNYSFVAAHVTDYGPVFPQQINLPLI